MRWVLLAYRLPREPSTPRIGLWRKLQRLGVAQLADGVVALPLDAGTRERLEWLADEVIESGGEASIWLAEPATRPQERAFANRMATAVDRDYERVLREAATSGRDFVVRRRTQARLRRDLRRIAARDYFPSSIGDRARAAVEAMADEQATSA